MGRFVWKFVAFDLLVSIASTAQGIEKRTNCEPAASNNRLMESNLTDQFNQYDNEEINSSN